MSVTRRSLIGKAGFTSTVAPPTAAAALSGQISVAALVAAEADIRYGGQMVGDSGRSWASSISSRMRMP